MDQKQPHLLMSASARAIIPIAGMLGGLGLGAVWANIQGADEFTGLFPVIRWGATGFFLGLALVVLLAFSTRREDVVSLRRLMVLVAISGLLAWYLTRILFGVIG
jgi:hypothetical protein